MQEESKKTYRKNEARGSLAILLLAIFLIFLIIVSCMLGRFSIDPINVIKITFSGVFPMEQTWTSQMETLLMNVRLPRILMAAAVGCCLACAGAAYQGTFQNPLVSPDILGVSQGAAFGAAVGILLHFSSAGVSVMAFVFALVAVFLVVIISAKARGNQLLVIVLSGVMVSSLFSACVSYAKLVADPSNELADITYWLMGSVTSATFEKLLSVLPIMVLGLAILVLARWKINLLTMGDDEAFTMGVNPRRLRMLIIFASTIITAASVSVTGMIGWVGLVIPHFSRMIVGSDYKVMLPTSMLLGASFLLVVDDISRLLTATEIPIGILTAFVGAPFFLYLITTRRNA